MVEKHVFFSFLHRFWYENFLGFFTFIFCHVQNLTETRNEQKKPDLHLYLSFRAKEERREIRFLIVHNFDVPSGGSFLRSFFYVYFLSEKKCLT